MNNKYLDVLKETLSDASSITPEKLSVLLDETVKMLTSLKGQMTSDDPEQRQRALESSLELKQALEAQMQAICKMTGLDPEQMKAIAQQMVKMPADGKSLLERVSAPEKPESDSIKHKKPILRIIG